MKEESGSGRKPRVNPASLRQSFSIDSAKLVSELISKTKQFERVLYPEKKYFLSDKMNFINPSISKTNASKILDFVRDLIESGEYLPVDGFYSDSAKFFVLDPPSDPSEESLLEVDNDQPDESSLSSYREKSRRTPKKKSSVPSKIEEIEILSEKEENTKRDSEKSDEAPENKKRISVQFSEKINKSTTELDTWEDHLKETNVNYRAKTTNPNRSFFGYYNFYNFLNHFVILYERLKLMKCLTDQQGIFLFLKQVMMLNLTNVIDSEFFGDVIGCLLSDYTGVFLNLDKTLSNIVKEIPSNEIDRFVISLNKDLFKLRNAEGNLPGDFPKNQGLDIEAHASAPLEHGIPSRVNQEQMFFLKTCHKLNSLTLRNKSGCKLSHIQSYINNNHLVNDHILKFEFLAKDQVLVIHKIKSIYEYGSKQVGILFNQKSVKTSFLKFVSNASQFINSRLSPGFLSKHFTKQKSMAFKLKSDESPTKQQAFLENEKSIESVKGLQKSQESKQNKSLNEKSQNKASNQNFKTRNKKANISSKRDKKVYVRNDILYQYNYKKNALKIFESRKEDKIFSFQSRKSEVMTAKRKLNMLKKTRAFRNLIEKKRTQ